MRNNNRPSQITIFDFIQDKFLRERERESRRRLFHLAYNDIISTENLLISWQEFLKGKKNRSDVAKFYIHFADNILFLHKELLDKTYKHGFYHAFRINDPKQRDIHKASVRDRLLHHAIYRILYPYLDRYFISGSYSCREKKGTHKAINQFRKYCWRVSKNETRTAWILKCDIKKFFANIDHLILKKILSKYIKDADVMWLLSKIIDSFENGLPLGNLTSQLFINVYMNEFDQYIKHDLKVENYIRYADDFVILSEDKLYLQVLISEISEFLDINLKLKLHPDKLSIKTLYSGVDFLGWIHFPYHRVIRTTTKRRMLTRLRINHSKESVVSYLGLLKHGNTYKLKRVVA